MKKINKLLSTIMVLSIFLMTSAFSEVIAANNGKELLHLYGSKSLYIKKIKKNQYVFIECEYECSEVSNIVLNKKERNKVVKYLYPVKKRFKKAGIRSVGFWAAGILFYTIFSPVAVPVLTAKAGLMIGTGTGLFYALESKIIYTGSEEKYDDLFDTLTSLHLEE